MTDGMLRFAIVLQTPKDEQSAVYIGYQSLARGLEQLNHSVTIVAPSDFPRLARLSGRWTPLVYPLALASWLGDRRNKFDLVLFHSYSGWMACLVGRRRPRALVMFHGIEPLYHRELRAGGRRGGAILCRGGTDYSRKHSCRSSSESHAGAHSVSPVSTRARRRTSSGVVGF